MQTKERVKKGKLSIAEAMNQVSPDSATYKWLERRSQRKRATQK